MGELRDQEIERLRLLCGCAYQLAGIHDAPEPWLDALSSAANGQPFSVKGLLPYRPVTPVIDLGADGRLYGATIRGDVTVLAADLRQVDHCTVIGTMTVNPSAPIPYEVTDKGRAMLAGEG